MVTILLFNPQFYIQLGTFSYIIPIFHDILPLSSRMLPTMPHRHKREQFSSTPTDIVQNYVIMLVIL